MGLLRQKNGRRFDHQRVVHGGHGRCRDESLGRDLDLDDLDPHDLDDLDDLSHLDLHDGGKGLHNGSGRG